MVSGSDLLRMLSLGASSVPRPLRATLCLVVLLQYCGESGGLVMRPGYQGLAERREATILRDSSPPWSHRPAVMRLRGGVQPNPDPADDPVKVLKELLGRKDGTGPSVLELIFQLKMFQPTTRCVLLANVAAYLAATMGLFGRTPEAAFGYRTDKVLSSPSSQAYRVITAAFLHLSHAHLIANLLVFIAVGSKLEAHLGSLGLAKLLLLLYPMVGACEVSVAVIINAIASPFGFGRAEQNKFKWWDWSSWGRGNWLTNAIEQQVSLSTTSIGFSGILFALNSICSLTLEPQDVDYCVNLRTLPPAIRSRMISMTAGFIDERLLSGTLCIPARLWPFAQVILTQLSDPARVSLCGHLSGAVAAAVLNLGAPWTLLAVPVNLMLWSFARKKLLPLSSSEPPLREDGRQGAPWSVQGVFTWLLTRSQAAWRWMQEQSQQDSSEGQLKLKVGDRVRVVNLMQQTHLNGLEGHVTRLDQENTRYVVRLEGVKNTVSVLPANVMKLRQQDGDVCAWTISQVSEWLRRQGYSAYVKVFEDNLVTGCALLRLTLDDMAEMKIPIGIRKKLMADIERLQEQTPPYSR